MTTLPDIEFHNAFPEARANGWQLPRYPVTVRHALNEHGRMVASDSCGMELRFVTPATNVFLTLSCEEADGEVAVFQGSFLQRAPFMQPAHRLPKGVPTTLHLTPSERMAEATDDALNSGGFSPRVWRIIPGRGSYLFHHIETFGHPVRPPAANEKPSMSWLAYGSSITHAHHAGYIYHAARLLHWDVFGKGLAGACHIEPEAAAYFVSGKNIRIITAELGVNMRHCFTLDDFRRRAGVFIRTLRAGHPDKPVVLITCFRNGSHHARGVNEIFERMRGFDAALRELVANAGDPDLHIIEGADLLPDITLLSTDLLHPSPSGHAVMGHLLAQRLSVIWNARNDHVQ
ncbi:lysophospholipase [Opitutaceae bacterium TAV5]|nr:lysophospholipase [Opitutaceae bacterium TAV5]